MFRLESRGDFKNTERFLSRMAKLEIASILRAAAQRGVNALAAATPSASGGTAAQWGYEITVSSKSSSIAWTNGHVVAGVPVVILLQYGHGTGTGGYVAGRDFINPALRPIFEQISEDVWRVVTTA